MNSISQFRRFSLFPSLALSPFRRLSVSQSRPLPVSPSPRLRNKKGQATTEVVLLFPIFMIIVLIFAKIFALLVLVQKMEVASFYAARRWQLESHRNMTYIPWDESTLKAGILGKVKDYLGFRNSSVSKFLNLKGADLTITRTQVWQIVTLKVETRPPNIKILCKTPMEVVCDRPYGEACKAGYRFMCSSGAKLEVTKYVPNRDRPIKFSLPGVQ